MISRCGRICKGSGMDAGSRIGKFLNFVVHVRILLYFQPPAVDFHNVVWHVFYQFIASTYRLEFGYDHR